VIAAVHEGAADIGLAAACAALGVVRASFYRWCAPVHGPHHLPTYPRALTNDERAAVLEVFHEDRFVDQAPAEVFATLLGEGRYLCSIATMYRILRDNTEVRERRDQLRHPAYAAPELLAERPNQLWSWDITKLKGPTKWSYYHLYVIIDVYSRYIVGWMVADRESAVLAEKLIAETCERQGIPRDQLTLHADRGSSMKSQLVAHLLADLGVTKTHSRPHVSDDRPHRRGVRGVADSPGLRRRGRGRRPRRRRRPSRDPTGHPPRAGDSRRAGGQGRPRNLSTI
jgi:putative transposase